MAQNTVNIPSGFGGLVRFSEEYPSVFNLNPSHIILFIVLIILFRVLLGVFLE